ncbi:DUF4403 family protein [Bradyrhizobium murdochi]|uniref:DUF4403 family protein n=1 Tax=Bradyrhizobium murdochi TaxID=1038859 RepID=UPI0004143896|nr:DUF4403 family protein [Bradyrhizobium murdochi]
MIHPSRRYQQEYDSIANRSRMGIARLATLALGALPSIAFGAEKPALSPDAATPLVTTSRISATVEFGLPALAAAIERDIPKRLATIDERVNCVHRRVFIFRINANCDVWGFVDRTSPVSLYGRGDRVFGAVSIYGAAEGQGANRFTARIRGDTEARATIEVEARPELRRDGSLQLNISDSFHWSEHPYLHVLGREFDLAPYVEPNIRTQLGRIRSRALAAARALDLHGKAEMAWRHAFEPIKLADDPPAWLQVTPQSTAFAGVRANAKVLWGSLELAGSAETVIGQKPPAVAVTALPPLGTAVAEPGTFDVILPVRINYDTLKDKISQAITALPAQDTSVREVQVYPSSGKLVIGLRIAKSSDTDSNAGQWTYLSTTPKVDTNNKTVGLSEINLTTSSDDSQIGSAVQQLAAQLKNVANLDYGISYQNLLMAANERLTRPLKDGFRMEGRLDSARLEKVQLLREGILIALHASGGLKILYGL